MVDTLMMTSEALVSRMKKEMSSDVSRLKAQGIKPKLVAVLIGDDPISRTYVELKRSDCQEVGIISETIDLSILPKEEARIKILQEIRRLNEDDTVTGIIPQMPFSGKISEEDVFSTLSPDKDVDGLTPYRLGKLVRKEYTLKSSLIPCTPKGVILLTQYYNIRAMEADVAIVGRSTLVGEPLRKLFQDLNATATTYHSHSVHLGERIREADIVVAAAGRPPEIYGSSGFRVAGDMVKEGSVVIGVGVRKDENSGKMLYDVDTKSLRGKCSYLTPNAGGVGPMTRIALLQNTLIAAKIQHNN
jgi:methylenetetrahydrofolate dehydrogenase (NADP+) / methenyltetrahydrofolate cyclohydrolase